MGAWIEIQLKEEVEQTRWVAPLVGAWIEISSICCEVTGEIVAPLVGAWIEIIRENTTAILK